jgi:PAS domain S-box-containing protein
MHGYKRAVLIAVITALILSADLALPVGVASGAAYVAPILVTLWFRRARVTLAVAAVSTLLTLGGHFLKAEPYQAGLFQLTNRFFAVAAIWATATVIILYKRANEARRRNEAEALRNLEELEQLYRTAPVGLASFDRDLRYTRINERLAEINGRPVADHLGRTVADMIPELAGEVVRLVRGVLETGKPVLGLEMHGETPAAPGRERYWIVSYYPLLAQDHRGGRSVEGVSVVVQEITDRKLAEEELRESEERFRTLADTAPVLIWKAGHDGLRYFFNKTWLGFTGRTSEQESGEGWAEGVHPDDREHCLATCRSAVEQRQPFQIEYRMRRHDGEYRSMLDHGLPRFSRGGLQGFIGSCFDITEHKQAADSLRQAASMRALTAGLLRGQEEERRRVARELHDGLNQRLAALSIEIGAQEQRMPESSPERSLFRRVGARIVEITDEVRRLSHQLHPAVLEYAGLVPALRSHCEEFTRQSGIRTELKVDDVPQSLSMECATSLFRLTQEALRNVAKHSGAAEALVRIRGGAGHLTLSIADTGAGFDVTHAGKKPGLGLVSMEERVRALGGTLLVRSNPQRGTVLEATIPLEKENSEGDSRGEAGFLADAHGKGFDRPV